MTKEELVAKLRDIEWEDFEVKAAKSELPKTVWETVSAFSVKSTIQRRKEGNDVENDVENEVENLTERQRLLLREIKLDKGISAKTLSLKIGSSHSTIQRELKFLQNKGILRRIGPDKGGYWKILSINQD